MLTQVKTALDELTAAGREKIQGKIVLLNNRFDTRTFFSYHHTAADTFDKVNPQELAESGAVVAVLAYGLANLEQPLPR